MPYVAFLISQGNKFGAEMQQTLPQNKENKIKTKKHNKRINADGGDALFFYPSSVSAAGYAWRYASTKIQTFASGTLFKV